MKQRVSWLCGATVRDRAFYQSNTAQQLLEENSAYFRVMQQEDAAPEARRSPAHHSDAFRAVRYRKLSQRSLSPKI